MTPDPAPVPVPRWLAFVLKSDRAGSSWYVGTGFFFAPVLDVLAPWPEIRTLLWVLIALAGLWLGLLGIAMATGLALILRAGGEISEDYWHSMLEHRTTVYRNEGRCPRRLPERGAADG